ncbi:MAG: hypothetical protein IKS55_05180 [Oscillospiraceae bacterium]|nr:hypothetical protein [Oscillospiraceae bacterium]
MEQNTRRSRRINLFFCLAVFAAMSVFFIVLHPIPIMDEDDVIYSVLSRKAIPIPGGWNPSRMMPELLCSLCGNLAGLCTALKLGRFISCQVAVVGLVFSLFIMVYVYSLKRLLEKRFQAGSFVSVCLSVLFLLLHFLIFRSAPARNLYLFHTYDECCVFFYTLPALLCSSLIMWFMAEPDREPRFPGERLLRESMLLLILYFAVFSNLFGSAILAAYAFCRMLRGFRKARTEGKSFLKTEAVWIAVLVLWILAAILESTGGRAGGAGASVLVSELGHTVSELRILLGKTALLFRLLVLAALLAAIAALAAEKNGENRKRALSVLSGILAWSVPNGLFLVMLSAVVNPNYAARPEAMFTLLFSVLLLMILSFAVALRRWPRAALLLPLLLLFVYSVTNTAYLTFADSNPLELDGHQAVAVENRIYESIIDAAEAGETEIWIDVPISGDQGNWPHNGNIGKPMGHFFLKYGIIDHEMIVHVHRSEDFNREFLIPLPEE